MRTHEKKKQTNNLKVLFYIFFIETVFHSDERQPLRKGQVTTERLKLIERY